MMHQVDAEKTGGSGYQYPVIPGAVHIAKVIHISIGSVNGCCLPELWNFHNNPAAPEKYRMPCSLGVF
jgi:hypothetical protein